MTLRKRYIRNIKKNFSFYLCVCLLTIIVVILYVDFTGSALKLKKDLNIFYEEYKLEDAQFTTEKEISDSDIEELEKEYDILLEKQSYIDFAPDYEIRVMKTPKKINLFILGHEDIETGSPRHKVDKGKILINTGLAEGNAIEKGQIIKLGNQEFEFEEDFERPDFLFPIKEITDTYAIKKDFGIALVSDEDFEILAEEAEKRSEDNDKEEDCIEASDEEESVLKEYYVIRYNQDNASDVRKVLNEKYNMLSYIKAESNARISTPISQMNQMVNMLSTVVLLMVIFIAVIISVVMGRRIKNDRRQIGVLIALGYKKNQLSMHYAVYGILSGLIGTVLGLVVAFAIADRVMGMLFFKIELLPASYTISISNVIISIMVPTILYTFSVYRSARKIMKNDVISMISGRSMGHGISKLRMKRLSIKTATKYKIRQIVGKPGRSIIVIIGLAFGGMLYAFCLTCIDSMDSYVKNTVDQIGTFEYEYFLTMPELGSPEEGNAIFGVNYEVKGREDSIMLLGIDSPDMISFKDKEGNKLEYDKEHFYITSMASTAFNVGVGDAITIVNPITLDEYTVKVTDVVLNDSQSAIYCSRENAIELLEIDVEGLNRLKGPSDMKEDEMQLPYNIIMSENALSIDSDKLVKTISKQSLADQINEVKINMERVTGVINVFAISICIVVVYMMVNVLITESTPTVSMLKVLGYRNKEINKMLVNVYHLLVPIAIVISLILGYYSTKAVFIANVSVYKTLLETCIYPISIVKLIILILVSYAASILLLRGKAGRVDLVESLKDNRE
ncbi:MAG: ABC transporter permease [Eubacterium sp.]|nr:ABC transporter permease [Eubacterium sp.]